MTGRSCGADVRPDVRGSNFLWTLGSPSHPRATQVTDSAMLPDFPEIKAVLLKRVSGTTRLDADSDPVLGMVQRFTLSEGDRVLVQREDGSEAVIDFSTPIETVVELPTDAIRTGGPATTREATRQMSDQLNRELTRRMFDTITQAVEEVGNVAHVEGRPFSGDLYLQMLRTMELSFGRDGEWIRPTIVAGAGVAQRIDSTLENLEHDPAFLAERDKIVNEQREAWRAREARRRLVD